MPDDNLPHVVIYTDGACDPNPGSGGWAAVLHFGRQQKTLTGSAAHTTNNRMELTAAVEALQTLERPCRIAFYTDSQYLKRGITEWLPAWQARDWRRKGGKLANVELWQALAQAAARHRIQWHWVKAHAGEPGNQRVDYLARRAIRGR
jgi:ribonuclease HI